MKTKARLVFPTLLTLTLAAAQLGAADTAIVKKGSVNVRGQPSFAGEVITQLKKGETVTVLEEITAKNPPPDEPSKWTKIAMPSGTPVWVNASFIDPANKTVIPRRLNLRAGPGENFSIVGRIEKASPVKEISTRGDWMEIEAPPEAFGFVASELLDSKPSVPPATPAPANTTPETPTPPPTPPATPPQEEKQPPKTEAEPAPTPAPTPPTTEPSTPAETSAAPAETTPEPQPPPPPRIVRREGIISGTVSIQAPTYYQLNHVDSGKVLDYLHSASTHINLKKLDGKRVTVTGEEAIDRRWPRTPVLEIETLDTVP